MPAFFLEIVEGPDAGRRVELNTAFELGRETGQGVVLRDQQASRRHARVSPTAQGAIVEDLNSTNGTFVNGNQIYAPVVLHPGDQLLIGLSVIELRSEEQIAHQPSAVRAVPPPLAAAPSPPDYIPAGIAKGSSSHVLDPLLDVRVKAMAKTAPLAVLALVVLAVLVFLATRS
jgi:pSer/pThr/pTyr-binding forkhead associated (FHA) protein